jgi:hypothetical protein
MIDNYKEYRQDFLKNSFRRTWFPFLENGDENTYKIWRATYNPKKPQLVVKLTSVRGHVVRKEKNFAILRMFPKNASSIAIQLKMKGSGSINGSTIIYELPDIKSYAKKNENEPRYKYFVHYWQFNIQILPNLRIYQVHPPIDLYNKLSTRTH